MERRAPTRYASLVLLLTIFAGPQLLMAQQDQTVPDTEWEEVLGAVPGDSLRVTLSDGAVLACRLVTATPDAVVVDSIDARGGRFVTRGDWWQGNRLRLPRSVVKAINVRSRNPAGPRAASFDQLRLMVGFGEKVTVTNAAGEAVTGEITSITTSRISVRARGMVKEFVDQDVVSIRQRRSDSLADGAKWGLAIGAAAGFLACGTCHAGPGLVTAAMFGGIGAGIGVGVDAMMQGQVVLYRSHTSKTRISVAPQLARSRQAVTLSIGF